MTVLYDPRPQRDLEPARQAGSLGLQAKSEGPRDGTERRHQCQCLGWRAMGSFCQKVGDCGGDTPCSVRDKESVCVHANDKANEEASEHLVNGMKRIPEFLALFW